MFRRFVNVGITRRVAQPLRLPLTTRPAIRPSITPELVRSFKGSSMQRNKNMEEAMNNIEELFSAAKDEVCISQGKSFSDSYAIKMEFAEEAVGSVYYHEDRATAEKAVTECLEAFDKFLADLPTDEMRNEVRGKVGMKMRELKMEYEALPAEGD
ncbi:hypothetical protein BJV82DRAFT_589621 [Fennellomyces sp. T-0311]|nr:hypothetical protein BJV82DRAFT_589621 [Fennellomyces sp. T-0311]